MDEPAKNHLLFWKLPVLKIQDQPCLKTNIKYNIRPTKKSFKFCHSPFPLKYVIVLSNIAIFGYCVSWGSQQRWASCIFQKHWVKQIDYIIIIYYSIKKTYGVVYCFFSKPNPFYCSRRKPGSDKPTPTLFGTAGHVFFSMYHCHSTFPGMMMQCWLFPYIVF